jgi:cytosine/adenosine deaminase-related metal-dependent hydrolase
MDGSPRLLRADWVAPFDSSREPLIRNGGILVRNGVIVAVGEAASLSQDDPNAIVEDCGDSILMPGLINAHTHLELSDCECGAPTVGGFGAWLLNLVKRSMASPAALEPVIQKAVVQGVTACLRFGVTSVGDITRHPAITRPSLRRGPLRVTSYGEIQALGTRRNLLESRLRAALDDSGASDRLRIGVSPHAPYTVEAEGYRRCLEIAKERGVPLATHLAESKEEAIFLSDHTGSFRELWDAIGAWDNQVPTFAGGPIRFAESIGLLAFSTLLAHVNYCDDAEMALLARGSASVVYCPRTHAYFGHSPHRWREMLAAGVNVAIGTDSCASSPNLNLVDDLRLARQQAPDFPVQSLWQLVTTRGAAAIGAADRAGKLSAGKVADVVAFTARSDEPLTAILDEGLLPRETWIAGERVFVS